MNNVGFSGVGDKAAVERFFISIDNAGRNKLKNASKT
ncbi:MAG: hypothetical protein ACJA04_000027 [Cellvibrionaceae bacterium]|jgi:hypothetical protein